MLKNTIASHLHLPGCRLSLPADHLLRSFSSSLSLPARLSLSRAALRRHALRYAQAPPPSAWQLPHCLLLPLFVREDRVTEGLRVTRRSRMVGEGVGDTCGDVAGEMRTESRRPLGARAGGRRGVLGADGADAR